MGQIGREPGKIDIDANVLLDGMEATTGWAALSTDTTGLATTTDHVTGTLALEFDKVDGAANGVIAGIAKTLTAVNAGLYTAEDMIIMTINLSALTDVSNVFVRLGTSASHYTQWEIADTELTTGWQTIGFPIGSVASTTGNGWNPNIITYTVVGVTFDAETNTLANIRVDQLAIHTAAPLSTISGNITAGTASDVNIKQIAGTATAAGSGAVSAGTQRVILATDDPAVTDLAALEVLATGIDSDTNTIQGDTTSLDAKVPAQGSAAMAASLPVTIATDDTIISALDTAVDAINTKLVTGTVIGDVNLGATDNAVLDSIVTNTTGLAGTVGGTELQVDVVAALPAGTNAIGKLAANTGVDIGDVDVTSITGVTMSNAAIQTTGDEAHDAPDAGNPVKIGMKAKNFDSTAPGTDSAEDDRVDAIATVEGRQYVEIAHPNYWDVSVDYAVAQTDATVKAAPGASLKLYITDIYCSNGATAGNITLLDGASGTVVWETYPAVNGGGVFQPRSPIALSANTLLAITSTTVTTHSLTICGFIAA